MLDIPLNRAGAVMSAFVMSNSQAKATVVLLPGGEAASGKIVDGKPTSKNFLSRSRDYFFAEGLNVVVAYQPSDKTTLDYQYRTTPEHIADIRTVVEFAQKQWQKPVWLVGTSRGSISATAAAIVFGSSQISGLILASSVTSLQEGAVNSQNIGAITVPTLVVHHKNDACRICVPEQASKIVDALTNAPVKKWVLIESGSNPTGPTCGSGHWHGFINAEKETVQIMTQFITQFVPKPSQ